MEKKKLLLVAVSVGVVLLILICIPLMVIAPKQHSAPLARQQRPDYTVSAPLVIEPSGQSLEQSPILPLPDPAPAAGGAQQADNPLKAADTPQVTTLTIPVPRSAAVPDAPVRPAAKPAATASAKPAAAKPAAAKPAPAQPAPAAKPAARPAAEPPKTVNNYWVQTGAFSTKIRAEGAKESLASKGITSIIENRDIDGRTLYRVRVGPYVSETEANYWLALVKSIDGFGDSQVRQSPRL